MYRYLRMIQNPENRIIVAKLLNDIVGTDSLVSKEIIEHRIRNLEKLRELGEIQLYQVIKQELMQRAIYKDFFNMLEVELESKMYFH